ncbi:MAG: hypothetical protein ACYCSF_12095 [Acidimicrobiales bacterium]
MKAATIVIRCKRLPCAKSHLGLTLTVMIRGHGKTGWAIVSAVGSVILGTLLADHYWWAWVLMGLLGALAVFLIISDWRGKGGHPMDKQDDPQPPPAGRQYNVTSYSQQGGITAGQVHIHTQTDPSIEAHTVKQGELDRSGQSVSEWRLSLKQQQAARGLAVRVEGESIINFRMNPDPDAGLKQFGTEMAPDGGPPWTAVTRQWLPPLAASYRIEVWTREPGALTLHAEFVNGG